MRSIALTPRNGMLPCAMRPRVVTSNQYTPRWPMQIAVDVERLGDDHVVGARPARCVRRSRQVRDAGEAAALLVHRAADLDRARAASRRRARSPRPRTPRPRCRPSCRRRRGRRSGRRARRRRTDRPSTRRRPARRRSGRSGGRPAPPPPRRDADDVHARMARRCARAGPSATMYSTSKPRRARSSPRKRAHGLVLLARRIDGRNPDEIRRELDDFVGRAIDFGDDAVDEVSVRTHVLSVLKYRNAKQALACGGRPFVARSRLAHVGGSSRTPRRCQIECRR